MAFIQLDFLSKYLNMHTAVNIALPMPVDASAPMEDIPCLYLLHDAGEDMTSWQRNVPVERYANEFGVAVIMPDGGLSCYENMVHGAKYRDYICRELPMLIQATFPVCSDRENNFIAGCSMGGFGALKLGLAHPEKWSKIGCFSAAHFEYQPDMPRNKAMLKRVYGDRIADFDAQIAADALAANAANKHISIWHCCGDDDILKPNALKTRAFFEAMPEGSVHYRFEMLPGRHDWALWDAAFAHFLDTLNLEKPEVQLF